MRPRSLAARAGWLALAATLAGLACSNPRTEAANAAVLNDAATEINGLKNDLANIEMQLDSLRTVIAKQDTTIARIAEINHIPIAK